MGQRICKEFQDKFFRFLTTTHPADLPGELAGKGSNEAWSAQKAKNLLDNLKFSYERVIFSALDIDTGSSEKNVIYLQVFILSKV